MEREDQLHLIRGFALALVGGARALKIDRIDIGQIVSNVWKDLESND